MSDALELIVLHGCTLGLLVSSSPQLGHEERERLRREDLPRRHYPSHHLPVTYTAANRFRACRTPRRICPVKVQGQRDAKLSATKPMNIGTCSCRLPANPARAARVRTRRTCDHHRPNLVEVLLAPLVLTNVDTTVDPEADGEVNVERYQHLQGHPRRRLCAMRGARRAPSSAASGPRMSSRRRGCRRTRTPAYRPRSPLCLIVVAIVFESRAASVASHANERPERARRPKDATTFRADGRERARRGETSVVCGDGARSL